MKILVTGDKGYVGSNLCPFLTQQGFSVEGYDLSDGKDILDFDLLCGALEGCDFVYNLAAVAAIQACAEAPKHCAEVNVVGCKNVVDAARIHHVKPILFSSKAVEGSTYYGSLKKQVELFPGEAVILRPSNIFGGLNYDRTDFVLNHFAKDDPIIVYGGSQTRDFVHMNVVLEKCLEAQKLDPGVYDVYSGYEVPINLLALMFSAIRKVRIEYRPFRAWEV